MAYRVLGKAGLALLISAASLQVGVSPAFADTRLVHPGQSIQAAVDAAQPGDTVVVLSGTYHEAVFVDTDGLTLRGNGAIIHPPAVAPMTPCGEGPQGQQTGICMLGDADFDTGEVTDPVSDVTVSGFSVEGFAEFGIGVIGGKNISIVANTTIDNGEYGIAAFLSTGSTIMANKASGSEEAGIYVGDSPAAKTAILGNHTWGNGQFGIFVRDSSTGRVVGNRSHGNCVGIIVLSTYVPAAHWEVTTNIVRDNSQACPPHEEAPPLSGLGIALAGASDTTVVANIVTGNQPTGSSFATGGIAVVSTAAFGGDDPTGNTVNGNLLRDNEPDLSYDGSGSGNAFLANSCTTSVPDGLC